MGSLAAAGLRPLTEGATVAVLDSAWFESLLADALDSEQIQAALRKALETEGAEHVVVSLFQSGLIDEFVDRLLSEGTVWSLIDGVLADDGAESLVANPALWRLINTALEGDGARQLLDSGAVWGLVERALSADGAGQLVNSEALWSVIEKALRSQGAERLVNSAALWALIDNALRSENAERLVGDEALWHLIDRALESEGAGRLVENPTLWVLVDRALRTDGAGQLINSEALWSVIEKALQSQGAERLVNSAALWTLIDNALRSENAGQLVGDEALWHLIDRALESEGAGRLVENPTLWVLVDRALRSDGAARLMNSPALWGLIGEALESEGAAELVAKLFDIGLSDQFVDRLLTSPAVWRLVDKIAASPAVTAAISQQGLGFADQVGNELRARCRTMDGDILRVVDRHRLHRSPASLNGAGPGLGEAAQPAALPAPKSTDKIDGAGSTSAPSVQPFSAAAGPGARKPDPVSRSDPGSHDGDLRQVGMVMRSVAWVIDAVLISVVAIMAGVGTSLILSMFPIARSAQPFLKAIAGAVFILWSAGYFVVFWSTTGQTPGARTMQIHLVTSTQGKVKPTRALVRWAAMNLAALMLFTGYLPILFKRRGLPDYLARTLVLDAPQRSLAQVRQETLRATRDMLLSEGAQTASPDSARAGIHEPR